jgi:hypothetical protein
MQAMAGGAGALAWIERTVGLESQINLTDYELSENVKATISRDVVISNF